MKKILLFFLVYSFSLQAQITVKNKLQQPNINLSKKQNNNQISFGKRDLGLTKDQVSFSCLDIGKK